VSKATVISRDIQGFEAIFDAILFLTILSIGAVLLQTTLVSSLQETEADSITETSVQSRASMEVFLRTWVYFDADGDGEDFIRGDTSSAVNEAIHQLRTGEISQQEFEQFTTALNSVLRSIVPPGHGYRFKASLDDSSVTMTLGLSADESLPTSRNLHFANGDWVVPALGAGDSGITLKFELVIWIR